MTLYLNGSQLSDLFFNHSNRNYEQLNYKEDVSEKELYAAVLEDAKEFCAIIGLEDNSKDIWIADLTNDFIDRL